jgi:hypothetical protein
MLLQKEVVAYFVKEMSHYNDKEMLVIPFSMGNHWVLLSVSTKYDQVYYCDFSRPIDSKTSDRLTHDFSDLGVLYPRYCGPPVMPQQIWIRPSSLQWQTVEEPSTSYRTWPHHSLLNGRDHQLKRTKPGDDPHRSFHPTSMTVGGQDFTTCQPNLTRPCTPAPHAPKPSVAMLGVS